ncbi:Xaa-Pro peptidase family protein [Mesorhizobium sp. M2A.F.Ca.ET.039.01.1.1]|uniref:M24 family metallopeptidase n=1 Tax=Mesorhizobium sp. M2A.F.Ca.ET.039.01.1.1 TaxID=2496746 RepID=UPI000FCA5899|nr:Xaa-Pro peptidase family protein [Mesorhizobium sp. M2A.F.Ca.ET.039.01.1.1]RWX68850.1 M24 family metallopeptidase [Mesorhizobium sp. M2A.F.Ca.ET.039.01.1.1]
MKETPANSRLNFPSDADYAKRVERARTAMKQEGIDVLALSGVDNHRFFTGLDGIPVVRPIWFVLPQNGAPAFVSPRIEASEIQAQSNVPVAAEWVEWEEPAKTPMSFAVALANHLGKVAPTARIIGVDFDGTWARNLELAKETIGAERIRDVSAMLREVRRLKDAATIDVVRRCADIVTHQFKASREVIAPGIPDWEVALASRSAAMRRAAEWWNGDEEHAPLVQGFHVMASGERSSRAHPSAGGRIMREGDIMQLCYCGRPFFGHGICFDRPVVVGSKALPAEVRKIVDVARAAQEAALAKVRPGVRAGEVHAAAVEVIQRGGWDNPFRHRTGRGVGLSDPEWPELKANDPTVLEPGMLLGVEPGVYIAGVGGARFGDTILVTETGYEPLTPLDLGRAI